MRRNKQSPSQWKPSDWAGLGLLPGPLPTRRMFCFCRFAYKCTFFSPRQCLWLVSSLDTPHLVSRPCLEGGLGSRALHGGRPDGHFGVSSRNSHRALQRVARRVLGQPESHLGQGPSTCKSCQRPSPGPGWGWVKSLCRPDWGSLTPAPSFPTRPGPSESLRTRARVEISHEEAGVAGSQNHSWGDGGGCGDTEAGEAAASGWLAHWTHWSYERLMAWWPEERGRGPSGRAGGLWVRGPDLGQWGGLLSRPAVGLRGILGRAGACRPGPLVS